MFVKNIEAEHLVNKKMIQYFDLFQNIWNFVAKNFAYYSCVCQPYPFGRLIEHVTAMQKAAQ